MAEETLKQIGKVPEPGAGRDAVHIAVVPVVAGEQLSPGERVSRYGDGLYGKTLSAGVGIADPFRTDIINAGTRFWLFLHPGSITSLRHVWTHPSLPDESAPESGTISDEPVDLPDGEMVRESRDWLSDFASEHGEDYDQMMLWAARYQETGEKEIGGMEWMNYGSPPEFWSHWSVVTGKLATRSGDFWTCEC